MNLNNIQTILTHQCGIAPTQATEFLHALDETLPTQCHQHLTDLDNELSTAKFYITDRQTDIDETYFKSQLLNVFKQQIWGSSSFYAEEFAVIADYVFHTLTDDEVIAMTKLFDAIHQQSTSNNTTINEV